MLVALSQGDQQAHWGSLGSPAQYHFEISLLNKSFCSSSYGGTGVTQMGGRAYLGASGIIQHYLQTLVNWLFATLLSWPNLNMNGHSMLHWLLRPVWTWLHSKNLEKSWRKSSWQCFIILMQWLKVLLSQITYFKTLAGISETERKWRQLQPLPYIIAAVDFLSHSILVSEMNSSGSKSGETWTGWDGDSWSYNYACHWTSQCSTSMPKTSHHFVLCR